MPDLHDTGQALCIDAGPFGYFNDKQVRATILRGYTHFSITATVERIKDTEIGRNLQRQIDLCRGCPFGQYGSLQEPADLLFQHCLPILKRLAPQTSLHDIRLESFIKIPTYHIELASVFEDDEVHVLGQDNCLTTSGFYISPIPTAQLSSFFEAIPHFHAAEIQVSPTEHAQKSLTSVQGRVITNDGQVLYFKPRQEFRGLAFERELQILSQIIRAGLNPGLHVPKLEGIAVSGEHDELVVGMLMTMIESPAMGCHLMSEGYWDKLELHKKWEKQVTAILRELHAHGIVWGDVNPMNIVIDEAFDAWVIDYGGSNNVDFVDDDRCETVEGDWQGVERLFQRWLPKRARRMAERTAS